MSGAGVSIMQGRIFQLVLFIVVVTQQIGELISIGRFEEGELIGWVYTTFLLIIIVICMRPWESEGNRREKSKAEIALEWIALLSIYPIWLIKRMWLHQQFLSGIIALVLYFIIVEFKLGILQGMCLHIKKLIESKKQND